jgi:hypothetical protein
MNELIYVTCYLFTFNVLTIHIKEQKIKIKIHKVDVERRKTDLIEYQRLNYVSMPLLIINSF